MTVENRPVQATGVQPPAPVQLLRPPYLLAAATDSRGVGVTVAGDASTAVVELAAHGPWSPHLGEQVTAQLRLCLAGPSAAIIIDLQHFDDPYGVSMPFWLTAWRQARLGTSPVHLTFCLPTTTTLSRRLRNLRGPQPRVCATVPEARIAIAERISRSDRIQARLPPQPASVGAARKLVTQACIAWHLPHLVPDTALIMSELAANAVEHACTDFIATVARTATGLHLAVRDGVSQFPRTNDPVPAHPQTSLLERGRGLRLIHTVAVAWGAMPTRGGKVVWATVNA